MKVHPLADIFPMLGEEELQSLAADIKENGLIHPIMLDHDGELIVDGRNRQRACEIAGVEPDYDRLNGISPEAYIIAANLQRRNLTKGQQAMAYAMIFPEPKRGMHSEFRNGTREVSKTRLSYARLVLQMGPDDLAPAVIAGGKSLDDALVEARQRQNRAHSEEQALENLRQEVPDLADLVVEERMTLAEATAAANQRSADRQRAIDAGRRAAAHLIDFVSTVLTIEAAAELGERELVTGEQLEQLETAFDLLKRVYRDGSDGD